MSDSKMHWHIVNFKFAMLNDSQEYKMIHQKDSPIHPLIANEICNPIIETFNNHIIVWRFHRSFKPDAETNSFWFLFYSTKTICPKITKHIQSNVIYKKIKELNLLKLDGQKDIICEESGGTNLKDDNDGNWPDEVKEVWPYFIHGVSQSWLKLIQIFAEKEGITNRHYSFKEKINLYNEINKSIDKIWCKWGRHAMLHHLNGVFGYKFIEILLPKISIRNAKNTNVKIGSRELPGIYAQMCF